VARWERLVRDIAEEHGVFVVLANLVGAEGGKSFQGASTIVGPRGDVRLRAPAFDEAIVTLTLDLGDLDRARADTPMLADLRTALPFLVRGLEAADTPRPPVTWDEAPVASRAAPPAVARGAAKRPAPGALPVVTLPFAEHGTPSSLSIDPAMVEGWLVRFLRQEFARRGFDRAVVGLSGGVDSAVVAFLCARAFGAEQVHAIRMPYRTSSPDSLAHAQLVIDALGIHGRTIDISPAVDGYLAEEPDADGARRGNVMARTRMIALFDQSAKLRALPVGTGNKTERLFGYFTWHADDSPPVNPIGDLFKTQVWALARHLGVPEAIVTKPASADLVKGQTDEGDFGISYAKADVILNWLLHGYEPAALEARGFDAAEVALVRRRLEGTHWKRRLPASAMVSPTAIGESYLRPVDY
jgi:NAD+ synthetase